MRTRCDTRGLDLVGEFLGDFLIDVDDYAALEVLDLLERNTADNAVAQRLDFDAAFDDGFDVNAVGGAAIVFVMMTSCATSTRTPREVAGVGGLESGVSQIRCARRAWR